jgi:hypothetical protein
MVILTMIILHFNGEKQAGSFTAAGGHDKIEREVII